MVAADLPEESPFPVRSRRMDEPPEDLGETNPYELTEEQRTARDRHNLLVAVRWLLKHQRRAKLEGDALRAYDFALRQVERANGRRR